MKTSTETLQKPAVNVKVCLVLLEMDRVLWKLLNSLVMVVTGTEKLN